MKVIGWIVAVPLIFFGLFVALRFAFCRPNYFVVKTATPVAERIADYIVEHGLPERFDAIPGLPYELKGCKRISKYEKEVGLKDIEVSSAKDADRLIISEICGIDVPSKYFYKLTFWFVVDYRFPKRTFGSLRIKASDTAVNISFKTKNDQQLMRSSIGIASTNTAGICRSFKQ